MNQKIKMKNLLLILVLTISIISCNSRKINPGDKKYFQEMFKFKGDVKEIQRKKVTDDLYFFMTTTFDQNGTPSETIQYNKDGTVQSREPWTKLTEEEEKEELRKKKQKNEYDSQKRLIKQIEYYNGTAFETEYKYDETGKKAEEIKKVGDRNIQSSYDSNGLLKEIIISILEDGELYYQSKENYIYNKNHYLIEKQVYSYLDEDHIYSKDLYEYDNRGSLIKTTTYFTNGAIEIEYRKIIYY